MAKLFKSYLQHTKSGVATIIMASMITSSLAMAESVADFYRGKTITVYVGYGPGGGYDTNGRVFAQHLKNHIPGNPNTLVKNMPGAGSKRLINYLYNVAPKDGTVIGIFASQAAMEPILLGSAAKGANYDPLKFTWIGSLDQFSPIGIAWHTSGVKTIEDVMKKELKVGTAGGGLTDSIYSRLLNGMLGTKFVQIAGYKGSRDTTHAMEQGEIPGYVGWYWAGLKRSKPHWLKKKLVNVFMQFGMEKNPDMPGVPWIFDVLKKPNDKKIFRLILSNLALARPFAGPPGIPADRAAALRAAFDATVKDKEFLAAMAKAKVNVKPFSGKQIDALLKEVSNTPPELIKRVQDVVKQ
ncbi:MAG: hypothetical protein KDJ29_11040 [Hyphomicrobiales bacterium]|nr:hypothetical protein [Hyphomicrobiales bacterium]